MRPPPPRSGILCGPDRKTSLVATVLLIGIAGTIGQLLAESLHREGHRVLGASRDPELARIRLADHPAGDEVELRQLPASSATSGDLAVLVAEADVVVNAAGAAGGLGIRLADAAVRAGRPLLDVEPEQPHIAAVFDGHHLDASAANVALVPGAGLQHAIGDALVALAAATVALPAEAHVAYTFPDRGATLARASAGRRRSAAEALGHPVESLVRGDRTDDHPGEARRLAWFPRPVGPSHAAAIGGGEVRSVPSHLPELRTVRTYLAVPTWRAELLQAAANLARYDRTRRMVARRLERDRRAFGPAVRRTTRWGCVAEVEGADGVARAWAYGHDPYALTAATVAVLADAVLAAAGGDGPAGVLAPSQVLDPRELLDRLTERTDARWSRKVPDRG